jgi:GNAT superfamily N-acetyltransferase
LSPPPRLRSTFICVYGQYWFVATDLAIRQARAGDLPEIVRALGEERFFTDRLRRQEEKHGELFVALDHDTVVGVVYVWRGAAEERELREHLPGVPLLNHLEVIEGRRNNGVGTAIIGAAEAHVRSLGIPRLALGLRLDNTDAARLYKRLGYREWEYGEIWTTYVVMADGEEKQIPERCRILVKDLPTETLELDATCTSGK